jgi:chromate transport protein ChrA
MREGRDYGRLAALGVLAIVVPVGIVLIVYWTVLTRFPRVSLGGWLLVAGYITLTAVVATALTPFVSRHLGTGRFTWRLIGIVWVCLSAIVGLLAWPGIGPYLKPFFDPT